MENQLQINNRNQNSPLLPKEFEIAKIIWHINQLVAYPLTDNQIEDWSKSLNKLLPELDLENLESVINSMKMGKIEWNYHLGIQNLFKNLIPSPTEPIPNYYKRIEVNYTEQ